MGVAGLGVLVGGLGVLVGGIEVFVGGRDVLVGVLGAEVAVGGAGVRVAEGTAVGGAGLVGLGVLVGVGIAMVRVNGQFPMPGILNVRLTVMALVKVEFKNLDWKVAVFKAVSGPVPAEVRWASVAAVESAVSTGSAPNRAPFQRA